MARWHWALCVRAGCSRADGRHPSRAGAWLLALACLLIACDRRPDKKLIEFGWDEPDTAYLRQHIGRMDRAPFDGCAFHVMLSLPDGRSVNLAWRFWGKEAFPRGSARGAREDLWKAPRRHLRHNFLRLNVTPGDVDWYEDFSPVLANARLAADVARDGGCAGILLDTEAYETPLFDYRRRPAAGRRSWGECAAQARQRGRELMHAFEQGFPGLTLLLTFGHELPWLESGAGQLPLADCRNGLLASFVDGLIDGCRQSRIVDGYELSYGMREPRQFEAARASLVTGLLPIVASPEQYRAHVSFGFGLWLDYDWRQRGWSSDAPERNYFTPQAFEHSLRAALRETDEYVWIYSETPRFWTPEGRARALPAAYVSALWRVRRELGLD